MRLFVKEIYSQMDTNDSYNESEFLNVFADFDLNGDGKISKAEMRVFL